MRVNAAIFLAVMLLASQCPVRAAEGAPLDKASAGNGIGRIGTLSPDEARRAARARQRAAAAAKNTPSHTAGIEHDRNVSAPSPKAKAATPQVASAKAHERHLVETHPRFAAAPPVRRTPPTPAIEKRRMASKGTLPAHIRADRPPNRRFASRRQWDPRMGYRLPPGVPLYAVPPRYEYGYADGYGEMPPRPYTVYQQDFPPYPRAPYGYAR